jgi:hypothetical protein
MSSSLVCVMGRRGPSAADGTMQKPILSWDIEVCKNSNKNPRILVHVRLKLCEAQLGQGQVKVCLTDA